MKTYNLNFTITVFLFITTYQFLLCQEKYLSEHNYDFQDIAVDIAVSPQGNVYVTGNRQIYSSRRMMTIKYNPSGQEIWRNFYDGEIGFGARTVALEIDQFENIYVIGNSINAYTDDNFVTIKYDATGELKWVANYNSTDSSDERTEDLYVDQFGFVYVTGRCYRNSEKYNYLTIKYDFNGNLVWEAEYNGSGNNDDVSKSIAVDNEQNVFITGNSYDLINDYDYITIKYDKFGTQRWIARYNGPFNGGDFATCLSLDPVGNVCVTGYSYNGTSNHHDFCTIKYDSQGVEKFVQRFRHGNSSSGKAEKIITDSLSNIYVLGWNALVGPSWDIITLKYNSTGTQLWSNIFDRGYKDDPADVVIDILEIYI